MFRRTRLLAASALAAAGALTAVAPSASADDTPTGVFAPVAHTIPLPTFTVVDVCGPDNDIVTVDPEWQRRYGTMVDLFANSLTFQGGKDGGTAKPAGMIRPQFRRTVAWEGASKSGWDRFWLYPGTVAPIVDTATDCRAAVGSPHIEQIAVRGPHNDGFTIGTGNTAGFWDIVSVTWQGNRATVTARTKPGLVGPDGTNILTQTFTDRVNVGITPPQG